MPSTPHLAELYHLVLLLFGHGLPNLLIIMGALDGPHHFIANHVALPSSLSMRAPSGTSTSVMMLLGVTSRHGASIGNSALGGLCTGLLGVDGQSQ